MKALFIDHFDSFTYNVVHLFNAAGASIEVLHVDDARLSASLLRDYRVLLVGPGPGNPTDVPQTVAMIRSAAELRTPIFGVCLGLQAIGAAFGARIIRAPILMHGKTSVIAHDGNGVLAGVPGGFTATRYHSLCLDERSVPPALRVTARSEDGVIQGVQHRELPIFGVQFHPESILSEHGRLIAENFLRLAAA